MKPSPRSARLLPLLVLLAGLAAGTARADQVVYFQSGKVIVASSVEEKGGWTFLEFIGGGILGVPSVKIDRIEESELVKEETAAVGNTIQAPDVSRRASSRRNVTAGRPFQPAAQVNPGASAGAVPGSHRGANRGVPAGNLPGRGRQGRTPGRNLGGLPQTPQLQQGPGSPFGLRPIDLSGNAGQNQRNPEEEGK